MQQEISHIKCRVPYDEPLGCKEAEAVFVELQEHLKRLNREGYRVLSITSLLSARGGPTWTENAGNLTHEFVVLCEK